LWGEEACPSLRGDVRTDVGTLVTLESVTSKRRHAKERVRLAEIGKILGESGSNQR
jgi:hypothetical protein